MGIDIVHRYTKAVLFTYNGDSLTGANLSRADLSRADLTGADLTGANLFGANLFEADLSRANLTRANLSDADLTDADLSRANLFGADLTRANLTDANLSRANLTDADLFGVNLSRANLFDADLSGANLTEANLFGANLFGANLTGANLTGANLFGANLTGANLSEAKGINLWCSTPLALLLDQPGVIRLYKLVNERNEGPFNGGIAYEMGKFYEVADANTDPNEQCGAGINVATLDWCLKEYRAGYKILTLEFTAKDIACIPLGTDGKIRLHRATVIGEKDITSIIPQPEKATA